MTLAQRCAEYFDQNTRIRGGVYWQGGRVRILEDYGDAVNAQVLGSRAVPYDVEIDWSQAAKGEVRAFCSCARYEDGFLCKHIWAALMAADAEGLTGGVRGRTPLYVLHDFQLEGDDDYDEFDEPPTAVGLPAPPRPLALPRPARSSDPARRRADWRRQLAATAERGPARDADPLDDWNEIKDRGREAWYVLNVGQSLERGKLVIDFLQREVLRSGAFGKVKRLSVRRGDTLAFVDPQDAWLLQCLLGNEAQDDSGYTSYYYNSSSWTTQTYSRCAVAPAMYELLLPRLCATQRFVWLLDGGLSPLEGRKLTWDTGAPWRFRLQVQADDAAGHWRINGQLYRGDQARPLDEAVLLLAQGLVLFPDVLARLEARDEFAWVAALRKGPALEVPYTDREELLDKLWSQPRLPELQLPDNLPCPPVRVPPQGRLAIKAPARHGHQSQLHADVSFVYDGQVIALRDSRSGRVDHEHQRVLVRAPDAERALLAQLAGEGLRPVVGYYRQQGDVQFAKRLLPDVVRRLTHHGWIVECEGQRIRRPGNVTLSVTSGIDWFELQGTVDFDGVTATLPQLLAALRNNEKYIRLGDGSQGMLPEEWLQRYGGLAQLGKADGAALKFAPSQALLLDALLAAQQEQVRVDHQFAEFRQQLRAFDGIRPQAEPGSFTGQLRTYQRDGLGWLHFLRDFRFGGCLADDMGLGKTVQVLALLEARRTRELPARQTRAPSIVVVPKSLVFNWIDEAARFTPHLRVLNYTGLGRADQLPNLTDYDLLVTTYGTLRRDIVTLKDVRFDYAILDESQAIKNAHSQAAKACRLLHADHRLAMTGTPIENHLGELWSLFEFLNPGMLGHSTAFNTLTKNGRSDTDTTLPLLAKALRPFLLRRTKAQVLTELPEKTEQTLYCEMEPKQRKLYDSLRDYYRASLAERVRELGLERAKIHVLEALLRLRQAACHPGLLDTKKGDEPSAKLDLLMEQLEEVLAEGHKALVFSQFTSLLALVRRRLDKQKIVYEYLDGQTRNRKARVTRFQEDPQCPLFLISLKAGGHGLNLTAADYVFILDPWWNPAVEAQAVDRAHRIGQTRHVFAYRLICRDTVEDKILELQRSKRALADAIVSADDSLIRTLTADDLQLLLS